VTLVVEPLTLVFTPFARGAPGDMWPLLSDTLQRSRGGVRVATQNLSDPRVVDALIRVAQRRAVRVRAVVEEDYLFDSGRPAPADPWAAAGENEAGRAAFSALARTGIRTRTDAAGGSLMHSNIVVATDVPEAGSAVLITSANLTRSNAQRHYNATIAIRSATVANMLEKAFDQAWAGDLRRPVAETTIALSDGSACTVLTGANGETLDRAAELIDGATQTVEFTMFTLATGNEALDALLRARARGVQVRGVVDGDQVGQPWDAVPTLRGAGADVRYNPGVLTGGTGRMHQKTMAVDGRRVLLGTGNWSTAARSAHETAVAIAAPAGAAPWPLGQYVKAEIDRLFDLSPPA